MDEKLWDRVYLSCTCHDSGNTHASLRHSPAQFLCGVERPTLNLRTLALAHIDVR